MQPAEPCKQAACDFATKLCVTGNKSHGVDCGGREDLPEWGLHRRPDVPNVRWRQGLQYVDRLLHVPGLQAGAMRGQLPALLGRPATPTRNDAVSIALTAIRQIPVPTAATDGARTGVDRAPMRAAMDRAGRAASRTAGASSAATWDPEHRASASIRSRASAQAWQHNRLSRRLRSSSHASPGTEQPQPISAGAAWCS